MPTNLLKARVVALLGGQCERCGYSRCLRALHLHHRDPAVKEPRRSQGTILREAEQYPERFILLCANCHIEEHEAQDRARMIERTCRTCGTVFLARPYVAKINRGNYCSRRCFHAYLTTLPSFNPLARKVNQGAEIEGSA